MLLSATVSGMPELSRLANCCVNVASSWSLGLRFWASAARKVGGSNAASPRLPVAAAAARHRAAFGRIHHHRETAPAARSAPAPPSGRPLPTLPAPSRRERRRALYENCGINLLYAKNRYGQKLRLNTSNQMETAALKSPAAVSTSCSSLRMDHFPIQAAAAGNPANPASHAHSRSSSTPPPLVSEVRLPATSTFPPGRLRSAQGCRERLSFRIVAGFGELSTFYLGFNS